MTFDADFYKQEIEGYRNRAKEAQKRGDTATAKELSKHAKHLDIHARELAKAWAEHDSYAAVYPDVEM
jgi:hypothetical protein